MLLKKHHKTLVKCLRKRIVNSVKRGEKITELEQFSEFPRALCDYSGNPVKGSKRLVTKLIQKRYPTSFSNTLPEGWKPEKVILEGMYMIYTSPLPTQHKTFYDYDVFLVQKRLLFHISSPATKEINVLFNHPGQMEFSPKDVERARHDTTASPTSNISVTFLI